MEKLLFIWKTGLQKARARAMMIQRTRCALQSCVYNDCFINFDPPQASTVELTSTRASTSASGSIRVRIGYVKPEVVNHGMNFDEIHEELLRRSRNAHITLVSAPPVSDGYCTSDSCFIKNMASYRICHAHAILIFI